MTCTVERITPWSLALDLARTTMGKDHLEKEPSSEWKRNLLRCEHSPIRAILYHIRFTDLPTFVSVHLVRHKFGVEHYVRSQRPDRSATGTSRHDLPQDAPVEHDLIANAAALIAMSKKRLCGLASYETRQAWEAVVKGLKDIGEVEMAEAMRPECEYRGGCCPELKPCGRAYMSWDGITKRIKTLERERDHWRKQCLEEDARANAS